MDTPDAIPISALQHWSYCPRQCALIHVEQSFADNLHTARGNAVHARVDEPGAECAGTVRIERAMPLWSDRLGVVGKADLVEFDGDGAPYPVTRFDRSGRGLKPAIRCGIARSCRRRPG